jgi:hypothetical protein
MSLYRSTTIGIVIDKTGATVSKTTSDMPPAEGVPRQAAPDSGEGPGAKSSDRTKQISVDRTRRSGKR